MGTSITGLEGEQAHPSNTFLGEMIHLGLIM